eukprot:GHVN01057615.1.p1 GENE.GHVN01057615.1~~GHVN01057615.1.p1  ORF type:complete len:1579 (-),score=345.87 GHVN01057615.1:350-5056(-)
MVNVNHCIIFLGGLGDGRNEGFQSITRLYVTPEGPNISEHRIDRNSPFPRPLMSHSATLVNRDNGPCVMIFGGIDEYGVLSDELWRLDLTFDRWRYHKIENKIDNSETNVATRDLVRGPRPCCRDRHCASVYPARADVVDQNPTVVRADYMFVFGGRTHGPNGQFVLLNDLWAFSIQQEHWAQVLVSGDTPPPRMGASAFWPDDNSLLFYGGEIVDSNAIDKGKPDEIIDISNRYKVSNEVWMLSVVLDQVQSHLLVRWSPVERDRSQPPMPSRAYHQTTLICQTFNPRGDGSGLINSHPSSESSRLSNRQAGDGRGEGAFTRRVMLSFSGITQLGEEKFESGEMVVAWFNKSTPLSNREGGFSPKEDKGNACFQSSNQLQAPLITNSQSSSQLTPASTNQQISSINSSSTQPSPNLNHQLTQLPTSSQSTHLNHLNLIKSPCLNSGSGQQTNKTVNKMVISKVIALNPSYFGETRDRGRVFRARRHFFAAFVEVPRESKTDLGVRKRIPCIYLHGGRAGFKGQSSTEVLRDSWIVSLAGKYPFTRQLSSSLTSMASAQHLSERGYRYDRGDDRGKPYDVPSMGYVPPTTSESCRSSSVFYDRHHHLSSTQVNLPRELEVSATLTGPTGHTPGMLWVLTGMCQWSFSCIGQFIDNSTRPGVGSRRVDIRWGKTPKAPPDVPVAHCPGLIDSGSDMLSIQDDGQGIGFYGMHRLMKKFGTFNPGDRTRKPYDYGIGFKIAVNRLALSCFAMSRTTSSVGMGLMSQRLLGQYDAQTLAAPVVVWRLPQKRLITSGVSQSDHRHSQRTVMAYSPFVTPGMVAHEINKLGTTSGTRLVLWGFRKDLNHVVYDPSSHGLYLNTAEGVGKLSPSSSNKVGEQGGMAASSSSSKSNSSSPSTHSMRSVDEDNPAEEELIKKTTATTPHQLGDRQVRGDDGAKQDERQDRQDESDEQAITITNTDDQQQNSEEITKSADNHDRQDKQDIQQKDEDTGMEMVTSAEGCDHVTTSSSQHHHHHKTSTASPINHFEAEPQFSPLVLQSQFPLWSESKHSIDHCLSTYLFWLNLHASTSLYLNETLLTPIFNNKLNNSQRQDSQQDAQMGVATLNSPHNKSINSNLEGGDMSHSNTTYVDSVDSTMGATKETNCHTPVNCTGTVKCIQDNGEDGLQDNDDMMINNIKKKGYEYRNSLYRYLKSNLYSVAELPFLFRPEDSEEGCHGLLGFVNDPSNIIEGRCSEAGVLLYHRGRLIQRMFVGLPATAKLLDTGKRPKPCRYPLHMSSDQLAFALTAVINVPDFFIPRPGREDFYHQKEESFLKFEEKVQDLLQQFLSVCSSPTELHKWSADRLQQYLSFTEEKKQKKIQLQQEEAAAEAIRKKHSPSAAAGHHHHHHAGVSIMASDKPRRTRTVRRQTASIVPAKEASPDGEGDVGVDDEDADVDGEEVELDEEEGEGESQEEDLEEEDLEDDEDVDGMVPDEEAPVSLEDTSTSELDFVNPVVNSLTDGFDKNIDALTSGIAYHTGTTPPPPTVSEILAGVPVVERGEEGIGVVPVSGEGGEEEGTLQEKCSPKEPAEE